MTICKEKCDYFRKHGLRHRRQHLTNCLKAAQEREDDTAKRNILAIIKREKNKAFWHRLNYALGKHVRGTSVRMVQVKDDIGGVLDFDTEEAVQEAIFNEVHRKRYNLAEEDPICQGALHGQFGYTGTSPTAYLFWTEHTSFRRVWMPPPGNCLRRLHISGAWCCRTRLTASSRENAGNNGGKK